MGEMAEAWDEQIAAPLRQAGFDAGFAAALSEHNWVGWYRNGVFRLHVESPVGWKAVYVRHSVEEPTTQAEPRVIGGSQDRHDIGSKPGFRTRYGIPNFEKMQSEVRVQSSEVPRTPEEPT